MEFKVLVAASTAEDERIVNEADIQFDYEEALTTNQQRHRVKRLRHPPTTLWCSPTRWPIKL